MSTNALSRTLRRPNLSPRPRPEKLAVTGQALRFWTGFRTGLTGCTGSNFNNFAFRIARPLNRRALDAAMDALIERHHLLNVHVDETSGTPFFIYAESRQVRVKEIDLEALVDACAEAEREALILRHVSEFVWRDFAFDEARGLSAPLCKAAILRLSECDHIFVMVMHHAISDAASTGIAARQFIDLYCGFDAEETEGFLLKPVAAAGADLAHHSLQFHDHVLSIDDWLTSPEGLAALSFWRNNAAIERPFMPRQDFAEGEATASERRSSGFTLHGERLERLRAFCKARSTRLPIFLLVATAAVVAESCDSEDACFRMVHRGRDHKVLEDQIGIYMSYMPLRIGLARQAKFVDLLDGVFGRWIEFLSCTPLYVEEIHDPAHPANMCPTFNYVLLPGADKRARFDDPSIGIDYAVPLPQTSAIQHGGAQSSRHWHGSCGISVWDAGDAISGHFTYSEDVYRSETISRLTDRLIGFIDKAMECPEDSIEELLASL